MKTVYIASIFAILVPATASAADAILPGVDLRAPSPVASSRHDWSGAYVGANVGGVTAKKKFAFRNFKDTVVGGAYLGYNHQYGSNLVTGVELDFNVPGDSRKGPVDLNYYSSARVRAGYAAGRFMPYVDGGLLAGRMKRDGRRGEARTHLGYTLGGGLEYAVTDNVAARISYHYLDLKDKDYIIAGRTESVGFRGHTIGAGFSVRF